MIFGFLSSYSHIISLANSNPNHGISNIEKLKTSFVITASHFFSILLFTSKRFSISGIFWFIHFISLAITSLRLGYFLIISQISILFLLHILI